MKNLRRYVALFILLMFASLGIAITIKASIGLAAFDAINQTLSYMLSIKVGTLMAIFQIIFVILQLLILKKASIKIILQIPMSIIMGNFINLFYYNLFGRFVLDNYLMRLTIYIIGTTWLAFFMSSIMVLDFITVPIESFPMVIAKQVGRPYGQIRQLLDIIFIIVALFLTFTFSLPPTIREGTIIGALMFGPLLTIFMPRIEEKFKQWKLIPFN